MPCGCRIMAALAKRPPDTLSAGQTAQLRSCPGDSTSYDFMHLLRREKRWVAVAGAVACLSGALVAYLALQPELEAQFHGGVLDEDRTWVFWHDVRVAAVAFAVTASAIFAALGLLPVLLHRLLRGARG